MTLPEAAKKYSLNPDALRVAANRRTLKAKKIGRDWHVTDAQMLAFVARKTKS